MRPAPLLALILFPPCQAQDLVPLVARILRVRARPDEARVRPSGPVAPLVDPPMIHAPPIHLLDARTPFRAAAMLLAAGLPLGAGGFTPSSTTTSTHVTTTYHAAPAYHPSSSAHSGARTSSGAKGTGVREGTGETGTRPQVVHLAAGGQALVAADGTVRELRTPSGARILRGSGGFRQVEWPTSTPGRIAVGFGDGSTGYVQQDLPSQPGGLVQRTFARGGEATTSVYRTIQAPIDTYYVYLPKEAMPAAFGEWVRSNREPEADRSGKGAASAGSSHHLSWWQQFVHDLLKDLVKDCLNDLAQGLQGDDGAPPPEILALLSEEVERELDSKEFPASQAHHGPFPDPPPMFRQGGPRTFLVTRAILAAGSGDDNQFMPGDVLQLLASPSFQHSLGQVRLIRTRGGRNPVGSTHSVHLTDLQECRNTLVEAIHLAFARIRQQEPQEGLPPLPPPARGKAKLNYTDLIRQDPEAPKTLRMAMAEARKVEETLVASIGTDPAPVQDPPGPGDAGASPEPAAIPVDKGD